MKHVLGPIALGVAVMVVIVGCGASPSTPSSSNPAPAASTSTAATEVPTSAATTESPSEIAGASPAASLQSLPAIFSSHADPALEGQLPAEVSGTVLQRYSITLSDLLDAGGDRAAIDAFLQGIGKTEADGSLAAALDPSNALGGGIFAFKVNGADTATLLAGIVAVERSDLGVDATTRQATVGGKRVTIVSVGTGVNDTEWIYGRDDLVYVVHAGDETHAAAFLQALP
jgi:hypothetical protein